MSCANGHQKTRNKKQTYFAYCLRNMEARAVKSRNYFSKLGNDFKWAKQHICFNVSV